MRALVCHRNRAYGFENTSASIHETITDGTVIHCQIPGVAHPSGTRHPTV